MRSFQPMFPYAGTVVVWAELLKTAIRAGTPLVAALGHTHEALPEDQARSLPEKVMRLALRQNHLNQQGEAAKTWAHLIWKVYGDVRPLRAMLVHYGWRAEAEALGDAFLPEDWWKFACRVIRKSPVSEDRDHLQTFWDRAGRREEGIAFLRAYGLRHGIVRVVMEAVRLSKTPLTDKEAERLLLLQLRKDSLGEKETLWLAKRIPRSVAARRFVRQWIRRAIGSPLGSVLRLARSFRIAVRESDLADRLARITQPKNPNMPGTETRFHQEAVRVIDALARLYPRRWKAKRDGVRLWAIQNAVDEGQFVLALTWARRWGIRISAEDALRFYVRWVRGARAKTDPNLQAALDYAIDLLTPKGGTAIQKY